MPTRPHLKKYEWHTIEKTEGSLRVPYGYTQSEDKKYWIPDSNTLDHLEYAKILLKRGCSSREVAGWLTSRTGNKISHQGLLFRIDKDKDRKEQPKVIGREELDAKALPVAKVARTQRTKANTVRKKPTMNKKANRIVELTSKSKFMKGWLARHAQEIKDIVRESKDEELLELLPKNMQEDLRKELQEIEESNNETIEDTESQEDTNVVFKANVGPQTDFLAASEDEVFYGGARGGGKVQPYQSLIATPFGYRELGALKEGDTILSPSGSPQKVLKIYEQGILDFFEFEFEDGSKCESGLDHLWLIKKTSKSSRTKRDNFFTGYFEDGEIATTKDIINWLDKKNNSTGKFINKQNIVIPVCKPLKFNRSYRHNPLTVDPYFLGVMLGDGCFSRTTENRGYYTGLDKEIAERLTSKGFSTKGTLKNWKVEYKGIKEKFDKLGLLQTCAQDKFIPECYKWSNLQQRIELMQGLIDTDGYVDSRGHISYVTISKQLAEDVQFVARSLGANAKITSKIPTYTHEGKKKEGQLAYTVWINPAHNNYEDFVYLTRKRGRIPKGFNGGVSERGKRIVSYKYTGKKQGRCIAVSDPSSLYLTNDFIVTHNTYSLIVDPLRYFEHPKFSGLLIRRTMPELRDIINDTLQIYPKIFPKAKYNKQENCWYFPSGARMEFGYAENAQDAERYRGRQYSWIGIDELPQYPTPDVYNLLKSSNRSSAPDLPTYIRSTGNPGGVGCVPYGRVWTSTGWKNIEDIEEGELVYSVNKNKELELRRVTKTHKYYFDDYLVRCSTRNLNFIVTDNHRFPELIRNNKTGYSRYELREFKELSGQATLLRQVNWCGEETEYFTLHKTYTGRKRRYEQPLSISFKDYCELMGWYLSEGSFAIREREGRTEHRFEISQVKEKYKEEIENLLKRIGFIYYKKDSTFIVYSKEWSEYLKDFGNCYSKYVPDNILNSSSESISIFLNSFIKGDGTFTGKENAQIYTTSERLRDGLIECAIKAGYKVSQTSRKKKGGTIEGRGIEPTVECYEISISKNKYGGTQILTGNHRYNVVTHTERKTNIFRERYTGYVYCLTVEDNETFFIQQDKTIWLSGNSSWVKQKFIDPAPFNTRFYEESEYTDLRTNEKKKVRRSLRFIPATVFDNPYLLHNDAYVSALASLPEIQRKQMLEGDWDIIASSAFPEFNRNIHVIEPFEDYQYMTKFRAADWGYSSPFCCLWFAVDEEENIYVYREYYGKGVLAEDFAKEVARLELGEDLMYGVIDGSTKANRGDRGPTIFETINKELKRNRRKLFRPADRSAGSRVAGKQEVHKRLSLRETGILDENGEPIKKPSLFIFNTCVNLIRTLPMLQVDKDDPEKVDTTGEDHAYDALHYGLRSRPTTPAKLIDSTMHRMQNQFRAADPVFGY